jgi:hypothetical protein
MRGAILVVCSKGNEQPAREVFESTRTLTTFLVLSQLHSRQCAAGGNSSECRRGARTEVAGYFNPSYDDRRRSLDWQTSDAVYFNRPQVFGVPRPRFH